MPLPVVSRARSLRNDNKSNSKSNREEAGSAAEQPVPRVEGEEVFRVSRLELLPGDTGFVWRVPLRAASVLTVRARRNSSSPAVEPARRIKISARLWSPPSHDGGSTTILADSAATQPAGALGSSPPDSSGEFSVRRDSKTMEAVAAVSCANLGTPLNQRWRETLECSAPNSLLVLTAKLKSPLTKKSCLIDLLVTAQNTGQNLENGVGGGNSASGDWEEAFGDAFSQAFTNGTPGAAPLTTSDMARDSQQQHQQQASQEDETLLEAPCEQEQTSLIETWRGTASLADKEVETWVIALVRAGTHKIRVSLSSRAKIAPGRRLSASARVFQREEPSQSEGVGAGTAKSSSEDVRTVLATYANSRIGTVFQRSWSFFVEVGEQPLDVDLSVAAAIDLKLFVADPRVEVEVVVSCVPATGTIDPAESTSENSVTVNRVAEAPRDPLARLNPTERRALFCCLAGTVLVLLSFLADLLDVLRNYGVVGVSIRTYIGVALVALAVINVDFLGELYRFNRERWAERQVAAAHLKEFRLAKGGARKLGAFKQLQETLAGFAEEELQTDRDEERRASSTVDTLYRSRTADAPS